MKALNRWSLVVGVIAGAICATGEVMPALGQDANVSIVSPTSNSTITIGPGSATARVTVTVGNGFQITGAKFTYTDSNNNPAQLAQLQASDFAEDPNNPGQYYADWSCGTGTYTNVTLKVNVYKPADSGGNPAQTDSATSSNLTVTKQQ